MSGGDPDASAVLVVDPADGPYSPASCRDLLASADPDRQATMAVTFECGPGYWVDEYLDHAGALPDELTVVTVAETTLSVASRGTTDARADPLGAEVRIVAEPDDLTGLAIAMDETFERWRDDPAGRDERTLCVDSVTNLLDHVDLEAAFRFIHVIQHQAEQMNATAHFHVSPHAHDDRTVATVRSLFDAVVEA